MFLQKNVDKYIKGMYNAKENKEKHMSDNQKKIDLPDEFVIIEENRKKRAKGENIIQKKKKRPFSLKKWSKYPVNAGMLMGLYVVGVLGVVGGATYYACQKIEEKYVLSSQKHVREMLERLDNGVKREICQKYDGELLMLIHGYQSGQKLNGFKMAPRSAVFMAHSDLMSKYKAYNPDVRDESRTLEDWILLDHINYRYYQFKAMNISNARGETENPYLDMLRSELIEPAKRVNVRHDNLFEGLKLDNVMKR